MEDFKKYSAEKLAKLKAIQDKYVGKPKTAIPAKTDMFGRPVGFISPRVQRVRDLQAGKRVSAAPKRLDWSEYGESVSARPRQPVTAFPAQKERTGLVSTETESFEDWTARMKTAMDAAADHLEKK